MTLRWTAVKQALVNVGCVAVEVFTAGKTEGLHRATILLLTCSFFSLLLSSLLLLYLLFPLDYEAAVAGGVAGCVGALLTVALFSSHRVRCLATLFVISIFIKKSRNLLLSAGTSLVILRNVHNMLENLAILGRSVVCSLKAKKASITAPFRSYVTVLMWIGERLRADLRVGRLHSRLTLSPTLGSARVWEKLADAEQRLDETVTYVRSVAATVSSAAGRTFPAVSLLVLLAFTSLRMKKYRGDMTYKNGVVSRRFVAFDEKQRSEGKPSVLPLTPEEEKLYGRPRTDRTAVLTFVRPVACCCVEWAAVMAVDALLYHLVNTVTAELSALQPLRVPLLLRLSEISTLAGIPFAEENHEKDFSYSVALFEKECLPKPTLLLRDSVCPLAAILATLLVMAFAAGRATRLGLRVCERFFPSAADERAQHLHARILRRRLGGGREEQRRGVRAIVVKPHFWCPLLFRRRDDPQSLV